MGPTNNHTIIDSKSSIIFSIMYSSWSRHSIVLLVIICLIVATTAAEIVEMAEENQEINLPTEGQQEPEVDLTPLPRSYGSLFGSATPEKRSWPELEGLAAEEAEKKIKEEMPMAAVHVVPQGSFVTMDFRTNRVRIFVDSSNKVVRAPTIG